MPVVIELDEKTVDRGIGENFGAKRSGRQSISLRGEDHGVLREGPQQTLAAFGRDGLTLQEVKHPQASSSTRNFS